MVGLNSVDFGVWGSEFRLHGLGLRLLRFRAEGLGLKFQGLEVRARGLGSIKNLDMHSAPLGLLGFTFQCNSASLTDRG